MIGVAEKFQEIFLRQKTIDALLDIGDISINSDKTLQSGSFKLDTIYEDGATVLVSETNENGDLKPTPKHIHEDSIEYIICVKGRVGVSFEQGYRVLLPGDCVSIPPGTLHCGTPIERGTKLICICIPPEKGYSKH